MAKHFRSDDEHLAFSDIIEHELKDKSAGEILQFDTRIELMERKIRTLDYELDDAKRVIKALCLLIFALGVVFTIREVMDDVRKVIDA